MRKTFKNYLTSTVFILLSGFLLFHANATSGEAVDSLRSTYCNADYINAANAHFTPLSSGFDAKFGRILIEETESEDLDHASDNNDIKPDFFYHSISALFHFMGWQHTLKSRESFIAYHTPVLKDCKRYIRFEVFRI